MSEKKFSTDFGEAALILLFVFFWGEPDLTDAMIYKLTGVKNWEQPHTVERPLAAEGGND